MSMISKEQKMEKVSIIMPAYNVENTIGRAIDSVLKQTYKEIELVIIDDGSTDKTVDIIHHYKSRDSRIKYVTIQNSGVSIARNLGIEMASGDYLMFLDSDDFFSHEAVSNLLKISIEHSADMVSGSYKKIEPDKEFDENTWLKAGVYTKDKLEKEIYPNLFSSKSLKDLVPLTFCTKIYSSELIKNNKIKFTPNIKIGEDNLFSIKCFLKTNKFIYVPNNHFYNYVTNYNSVTNNYIKNCWEDQKEYLFELEKLSKQNPEYNLIQQIPYAKLRCAMTSIANEGRNKVENSSEIKANIDRIVNDDQLQSSIKNITTSHMTFIRASLTKLIKHTRVTIIYYLVKFLL